MDRIQKIKLFQRCVVDYVSILVLWIGFFLVLPLAFVGPEFAGPCKSVLISSCTSISTTRWYWFGGYHAAFGPDGPHYPAVVKYWPTSTWEMWLLVLVSLLMAILLYLFAIRTVRYMRRKHHGVGQD
jgi:hypothetical protein